jgi:hypothetical protein
LVHSRRIRNYLPVKGLHRPANLDFPTLHALELRTDYDELARREHVRKKQEVDKEQEGDSKGCGARTQQLAAPLRLVASSVIHAYSPDRPCRGRGS